MSAGANLGQLEEWLQPYARHLVDRLAPTVAHNVRITSVYRSPAKQLELWNNRHRNPYPVAPPGRSYHEYRRAFDIVTTPYDALYTLGQWWRQMGGTWGPSDPIHFQA